MKWYKITADLKKMPDAEFNLGVMYANGFGVDKDYAEAARLYRLAAEQRGLPEAEFNLASLYDAGLGVPQDHKEAARWYRDAAGQGHAASQFNLRTNVRKRPRSSTGVRRSGPKWYRMAADQGAPAGGGPTTSA